MRRISIGRVRASLILVTIIASLAMIPSVNAAGMLVGKVTGTDMYDQTIPLERAKVAIYANGTLVESVSPGFDGTYSILLSSGIYAVIVENPGFDAQSKVVEIFNARSTQLDFCLEHAPSIMNNAFEFGLSNGGPVMVHAGGSGWTTILVTLRSGSPQNVSLSVSGLPSNVHASLSSPLGSPSFTINSSDSLFWITSISTVICTIMTFPDTLMGSYTVTLTGIGGRITHSTSFTLIIIPRTYSVDIP